MHPRQHNLILKYSITRGNKGLTIKNGRPSVETEGNTRGLINTGLSIGESPGETCSISLNEERVPIISGILMPSFPGIMLVEKKKKGENKRSAKAFEEKKEFPLFREKCSRDQP